MNWRYELFTKSNYRHPIKKYLQIDLLMNDRMINTLKFRKGPLVKSLKFMTELKTSILD